MSPSTSRMVPRCAGMGGHSSRTWLSASTWSASGGRRRPPLSRSSRVTNSMTVSSWLVLVMSMTVLRACAVAVVVEPGACVRPSALRYLPKRWRSAQTALHVRVRVTPMGGGATGEDQTEGWLRRAPSNPADAIAADRHTSRTAADPDVGVRKAHRQEPKKQQHRGPQRGTRPQGAARPRQGQQGGPHPAAPAVGCTLVRSINHKRLRPDSAADFPWDPGWTATAPPPGCVTSPPSRRQVATIMTTPKESAPFAGVLGELAFA